MANASNPSFETIKTTSLAISCDGGGGPLGHPRVYLHIDSDNGQITCPYCSRNYVYQPGEPAAA